MRPTGQKNLWIHAGIHWKKAFTDIQNETQRAEQKNKVSNELPRQREPIDLEVAFEDALVASEEPEEEANMQLTCGMCSWPYSNP